jgi:hypothetical protein
MTLRKYLAMLAIDYARLAEHLENPSASAEKAGLSSEDQAALFSGDQSLLYARLTSAE